MSDYIVGKKYRLLELNKSSAHYGSKIEGEVFKCIGFFGGCPDFIDENGCNFYTHPVDGYPKMELVEEEPVNMLMDYKTIPEFKHRTHKKHYRFKNREHIRR